LDSEKKYQAQKGYDQTPMEEYAYNLA